MLMEKLTVGRSWGRKPVTAHVQGADRVMLLDADPERSTALRRGLEDSGYQLVLRLRAADRLLKQVEEHNPDVLIIGTDAPDDQLLQQLCAVRDFCPRPVILFAEREAPKLIERVVQAGVNAFVVNDIQPHRLRPIITIAAARFNETMALRQELENTRTQLANRRVIDRAKGLLMQEQGFTEEQAYQALRKMSMNKGQPLAEVAETVVDVISLLDAGKA